MVFALFGTILFCTFIFIICPSSSIAKNDREAIIFLMQYTSVMDPELTVNDLRHVHEAVHPARTSWYDIGLQLQVPVDVLDSIEQENGNDRDRLRNMLKTWLKRGGATWGALSDALKSPTVGEHQLAKKLDIRARHERVQPQSTSIEEGVSILSKMDGT